MAQRALVTGANGFIGAHVAAELGREGYRVRGTLRDLEQAEGTRQAIRRAGWPDASEVELVAAELERPEDWEGALDGIDVVVHVASPLPILQPDDPDELVKPARDGALNVLEAARRAGVARFVMTSSHAAVCGSPARDGQGVYTEDDWTDLSDPTVTPYNRSKTIAERAARQFVEEHGGPGFATVNPGLVMGPIVDGRVNTSSEFVRRLLAGELPAIPALGFESVDVRDVASLHRLVLEHPEAEGGRFLCSSEFLWLHEMAAILREALDDRARRVPRLRAPNWLIRAISRFDRPVRAIVPDLGEKRVVSHEGAEKLGWKPRPARDAVIATAESLLEFGLVD
ncbi:MAG: NAD-dependent epimerase/dehydratase family protein [Myxococcota bacterium]|nr:NAD-dependent epimerase/dehydratase family protein [Myxococcota bacterium]